LAAPGGLADIKTDASTTNQPRFGNVVAANDGNSTTRQPPSLATDAKGQDASVNRGVRLDAPLPAARMNVATNDDASNRARSPLGAPIPAASAPSIVPSLPANTSSSNPQVESYDEDTYTCKGSETFRAVSQAVYQTDAYDQALLLFNRNHPLANDSIKQNPPLLQPGQPIYVPPLRILRKYYAAAIPDVKDTGISPQTPTAIRPVTLAPPMAGTAPAAAARTYRVGGNGEMIRDIARRTLGNGDRWTEIYQLNRSYDPTYPVPAGTDLRLPGDARADAQ
jgi:nucleoid-associated protein YgaU